MDSRGKKVAASSSKKSKSRRASQSQPQMNPNDDVYRPQPPQEPFYQPHQPFYHPQMYQPQQPFYHPQMEQQPFQPYAARDVQEDDDDDDDDDVETVPATQLQDDDDDEPNPQTSRYTKRMAKQSWTSVQTTALAKSFIHISEDKKVGNHQKRDSFWERVLNHYNHLVGGSTRTTHQLNSKWNSMNAQMTEFNGYYIQAERLRASGCDDMQVLTRAIADYTKKHPTGFPHIDAWHVVRNHPKWRMVQSLEETGSEHSDKRRKSSDAGSFYGDESGTHIPDLNENNAPTRPNRKQKSKTPESSFAGLEVIESYTELKKEKMIEMAEMKKREGEETISYLHYKKEKLREQQYNADIEFFCKPHDHLTGDFLEVQLQRKRELARKYDWPCNF